MNDYDFRQLSDKEFEVFCCDLLGKELSTRFERFKPGRDEGVDGRFFTGEGEVILQCKHWVNTPLSKLFTSLSTNEAPKVARLKPARYLLAVSNSLSRTDKDRLHEIFAPYIRSPDDIFSREDLNDLLAKYPEVEQRHYKLWIASSNVLSLLLNAPILGRSDFLIQDILNESVRYVFTKNHEEAVSRLEEKRVIIITGAAGVGKTTLARNILLPYLADGYELFSIGENISEAEGVFKKNKKQIFYFDDFLGSNYLEAISGNSGAHIALFIKRVRMDPLKRFVLTSRTTILNQGKIIIGALANQNTSKDEFEISLQSLSQLDKAKILYNHIWHSGLSDDFKEEIYKEKRYRTVVNHRNYNPRIISYITDSQRLDSISANEYWPHILSMLDNPADVWGHPFDAQHDDYGRAIVLLVAMNGRPISQKELSEAYYRYISRAAFSSSRGQQDFLHNLRHLCGSMLNRVIFGSSVSLNLFNPSIRDYLIARFRNDPVILRAIFMALRTDGSLYALSGIVSNKHVDESFMIELLAAISRDAEDSGYTDYDPAYVARLHLQIKDATGPEQAHSDATLASAAAFIEREDLPQSFEDVLNFYLYARERGLNVPTSVPRLVTQALEQDPTAEELERLAEIAHGDECYDDVHEKLREAVGSLLSDLAYDEFPASDVFDGLQWDDDLWDAKDRLTDMISERLDAFGFAGDAELIATVLDTYDLQDQARSYFTSHDDEGGHVRRSHIPDMANDIDDLFDRS